MDTVLFMENMLWGGEVKVLTRFHIVHIFGM